MPNLDSKKIPILKLENISKSFGSVKAIDNVNLTLYKGEILAILGENGSGKTTVMNVVDGIYFPDHGKIYLNDKEVEIHSPKDALKYRIGMVHQHFKLVDVFTGIDNIILGTKQSGFLPKDKAKEVHKIIDKYGFKIDIDKKVSDMSVSEKQTIEIIKTLYKGVDILILDEPTAVLTPQEIHVFFDILKKMRKDGKSIFIITHKLNEVKEVSDRVTILRKGHYIETVDTKKTTEKELADLMVGKKIDLKINRSKMDKIEGRLFVNNLCLKDYDGKQVLKDVSFVANSGEILGIAGIAGSGQKELLQVLSGIQRYDSGEIIYHHPKKDKPVTFFHKDLKTVKRLAKEGKFYHTLTKEKINFSKMKNKEIIRMVDDGLVSFYEDEVYKLKNMNPRQMKDLGIRSSYVPEDRLGMGLVGTMDIVDNMMLRNYRKGKYGFLNRKIPDALSRRIIKELQVVTPSIHTQISKLSGGNIQKLLVGRELASRPYVFTAAYPVRGLDINSSYAIYNLLNTEKEKGTAIVFAGEDLDVMLALCDRIVVLCGGKVSGIVDARNVTKEEVGLLMTQFSDKSSGENNGTK